jgi:hypothetical protein
MMGYCKWSGIYVIDGVQRTVFVFESFVFGESKSSLGGAEVHLMLARFLPRNGQH